MKTLQIALFGTAILTGMTIDHLCSPARAEKNPSSVTTEEHRRPGTLPTDNLWDTIRLDNTGRTISMCDELGPEAMRQLLGVFKP